MYNKQLYTKKKMIIMKETSELEKEYLSKITKIWEKRELAISEKIKVSMKVVDSIDKIKWPKKVPSNLVELVRMTLKSILLQEIEENVWRVVSGSAIPTKTPAQRLLWNLRN